MLVMKQVKLATRRGSWRAPHRGQFRKKWQTQFFQVRTPLKGRCGGCRLDEPRHSFPAECVRRKQGPPKMRTSRVRN